MFSTQQKHEIAEAVQHILRATNHPELPKGEITFRLHVEGERGWSWADIKNNGDVDPVPNSGNEHYENPCLAFNSRGAYTGRFSGRDGTAFESAVDNDRPTASSAANGS